MTDSSSDEAYWDLVDEFIDTANAAVDKGIDLGEVSAALLQASTRFGAFYVARHSADKKQLEQDKDEAVHKFAEEFKEQLSDSVDEYINNYKSYLGENAE